MRRPDIRKALGLGFDHRSEVVPAPGTLLLQIDADGREFILWNGFVQQPPVCQCPSFRSVAQRCLRRMQGDQRIVALPAERGTAITGSGSLPDRP